MNTSLAPQGDPAVEYWTRAMASVRAQEHRPKGIILPVAIRLTTAVAAGVAGYLSGHLLGMRGHRPAGG